MFNVKICIIKLFKENDSVFHLAEIKLIPHILNAGKINFII